MAPQSSVRNAARTDGKQIGEQCRRSTIRHSTAPSGVQILKLWCRSRQPPTIERPCGGSLSTPTAATQIAAARCANYPKNGSHTTGSSILDTLSSTTQVASPMCGSQYIGLSLDDASLHLTKDGFAFFQAQANLFRRESLAVPPGQPTRVLICGLPNASPPKLGTPSHSSLPSVTAPIFDTVPHQKHV